MPANQGFVRHSLQLRFCSKGVGFDDDDYNDNRYKETFLS
jgi:hypothetical protein